MTKLTTQGTNLDVGPRTALSAPDQVPHSAAMREWRAPVGWMMMAVGGYACFASTISFWFTRSTGLSRWTMQPAGPSVAWGSLFLLNLVTWCGWGVLAMVVFWLGRHVRLDRRRWAGALAVHVPASLVVTTLHLTGVATMRVALQTWWGLEVSWVASVREAFFRTIDLTLPVYWALLALQHAIDFHAETRARDVTAARLEAQLIEAQLQALQGQLHPHFLFNTLHAIATLVHSAPDRADAMIERLGDLLRVTLDHIGVQQVPLAEELEYVDNYLDIVQMQLGDRLEVRRRIDPDVLGLAVPFLVLQPIAENAVRHGLEPREGRVRLTIDARRCGDRLAIVLSDSGPGLVAAAGAGRIGRGVGLANVRARLDRLYGGSGRLSLNDAPDGGVAVTVEVPARVATVTPVPARVALPVEVA